MPPRRRVWRTPTTVVAFGDRGLAARWSRSGEAVETASGRWKPEAARSLRDGTKGARNAGMVPKPGVYFASVDGQGVLMDLIADRYIALSPVSARIWSLLVALQGAEGISEQLSELESMSELAARVTVARQMDAWRAAGLLADERGHAVSLPEQRDAGPPAASELDAALLSSTALGLYGMSLVASARVFAHWSLARRGLPATLRAIQRIPADRPLSAAPGRVYSVARADIASRRLRHQGTRDCLHHSLSLATALRCARVAAEICFGVRKYPFSAHAWVEVDGVVVNDRAVTLRWFSVLARF